MDGGSEESPARSWTGSSDSPHAGTGSVSRELGRSESRRLKESLDDEEEAQQKKRKRNKPTLSCIECVERKTKVCLLISVP